LFIDKDFSELLIKGKNAKGSLLTKYPVHRISLKSHGHSTLGGRKIWFDPDINRLNYDEHGQFLGEFHDDDQILVILKNGEFYLTNFDVSNHYENNILRIEKYQPDKVWTVVLYDADQQGYPYLKRFVVEASKRKQNFLGENANSQLLILTDTVYPLIKVVFGGNDAYREPIEIDAEQFIAVKGFKAKGKRISTWTIGSIEELEPQRFPEPEETEEEAEETEEGEIIDNDDELKDFIADAFGYKQTFSEVCKEDEYAKEIYKSCKQKLNKGYKILFKNVAYNDLREKLFKKMESDDFIILRED
jgi:topoisomerase-4 subunit A